MLLAAWATWAFFEFVVWKRLPAELVGTWEVQGGPQDGAIFDFRRNGSMVAKVNDRGMVGTTYATIRVEENKLFSTSKHSMTGEEKTSVMVIRTLTADEFVVEDAQGKLWRMRRTDVQIR
jgi:uncharacterized protein (TIGR03066 family)